MQVLVYLAERAGEVVTRKQILEDVWQGTFVGDEALTNAIRKLRLAFGEEGADPTLIQTIPKKGYRLNASVTPVVGDGRPDGDGAQRRDTRAMRRAGASGECGRGLPQHRGLDEDDGSMKEGTMMLVYRIGGPFPSCRSFLMNGGEIPASPNALDTRVDDHRRR